MVWSRAREEMKGKMKAVSLSITERWGLNFCMEDVRDWADFNGEREYVTMLYRGSDWEMWFKWIENRRKIWLQGREIGQHMECQVLVLKGHGRWMDKSARQDAGMDKWGDLGQRKWRDPPLHFPTTDLRGLQASHHMPIACLHRGLPLALVTISIELLLSTCDGFNVHLCPYLNGATFFPTE